MRASHASRRMTLSWIWRRLWRSTGVSIRLGTIPLLPGIGWPYTWGTAEVNAHLHMMGLTGMGKSKLLASYAAQLIVQGRACAVIDPHADLARDVVQLLLQHGYFRRPDAMERLLYLDFSRRDRFVPFNVLSAPYPTDDIAAHLVEACTRAWPS